MTTLAYRLAEKIKQSNPEQTHSIAVMQYSLSIILNTVSIILVSMAIGWLNGKFLATGLALISIMGLRMMSGGFHMKTMRGCLIVSVMLVVGIPLIPSINVEMMGLLTTFTAILMVVFAPAVDRNTSLRKDIMPYLKLLSVITVCSNFLIGSQVIAWAFLIQALTTIPWKGDKA